MTDPLSPEAIAITKRAKLCSIGDTEWSQWRHNPISAGFLQYMEDMIAFYRAAAADLLEAGQFAHGDVHQDKNPDCLRGQIVMLRQLHGADLAQIKRFYGHEEPEQQEEPWTDTNS